MSEPTSTELGRWRKLIRLAMKAAENVAAGTGDLAQAANSVKRALAPCADRYPERENPFILLSRQAHDFAAQSPFRRKDLASALKARAVECARLIDPPPLPAASAALALPDTEAPEPERQVRFPYADH